ncbi:hypothetical protein NUSPORA_02202 [Nucleospora cyclopteri]
MEFRLENNVFKLYLNEFYKNLNSESIIEIYDFWNNMWENNKAEKTSYEEYLMECTPDKDEKIMYLTIDDLEILLDICQLENG